MAPKVSFNQTNIKILANCRYSFCLFGLLLQGFAIQGKLSSNSLYFDFVCLITLRGGAVKLTGVGALLPSCRS